MPEAAPCKDYPLHIDIDKGTNCDGDADDNILSIFVAAFVKRSYHGISFSFNLFCLNKTLILLIILYLNLSLTSRII